MKRITSLVLAVLMVLLCFSGCGAGTFMLNHGTWDGRSFTNDSTGIKMTVADDWTIMSDEEISEMMDLTVQNLTESNSNAFSESVLKMQNIFDAMIVAPTGSNIVVLYENLLVSGSTKMTEEDYLNALKESLPAQATDFEYSFEDCEDKNICSNTYKVLKASVEDYGFAQYYCVRKLNNYMVALIITVAGDDSVDDMLAVFN